jgi:hypothetical protein
MGKKKARTDGDMMRIARRIDALQQQIMDCLEQIEDSEHPNKAAILEDMDDNQVYSPSWAVHIVIDHFVDPGAWDYDTFTYNWNGKPHKRLDQPFHKAARKAVNKRKGINHV